MTLLVDISPALLTFFELHINVWLILPNGMSV